jgi:hypothetical protein
MKCNWEQGALFAKNPLKPRYVNVLNFYQQVDLYFFKKGCLDWRENKGSFLCIYIFVYTLITLPLSHSGSPYVSS